MFLGRVVVRPAHFPWSDSTVETTVTIVGSIVIGICTGVFANTITNMFVTVWLPYYRNLVYRGVRIDGDWNIKHAGKPADGGPLADLWRLSATLEQKAYRIEGSAVAQRFDEKDPKKTIDTIHYQVEGSIFDRFVFIFMRSKDNHRIAHSSFHLEVVRDGHQMNGYRTFYGLVKSEVRAVGSVWLRTSATNAQPYSFDGEIAQPEGSVS